MSNDFELSYYCVCVASHMLFLFFDISQNAGVAREKITQKYYFFVVNLLFSIDHDDAMHCVLYDGSESTHHQ